MDITVFLAQLWGPVLLAIGVGMFLSRKHYAQVYRNLDKESLAALVFAIAGIVAGILQVMSHNLWATLPQVVISLLGWGMLLKGIAFALVPGVADRLGDWTVDTRLIPIAGTILVLIGGYLTWFAFFV